MTKQNVSTTVSGEVNWKIKRIMYPTANLRWKKGVLQQRWDGVNGEQKWMSVATDEVGGVE